MRSAHSSRPGRFVCGGVAVGVLLMIGVAGCGGAEGGADTSGAGPAVTVAAPLPTDAETSTTEPLQEAEMASTTTPLPEAEVVLVDFRDPTVAGGWATVNDPVMGGRSTSELVSGEEGLEFAGVVSLANNGGFASVRGPDDPTLGALARDAGVVRVRARGHGQTYVLQLRAAGQQWSYIQRFTTEPDVIADHDLPVEGFEAVDFFLNPTPAAPAKLDPSTISQMSIYILDKQEGPFALTLVSIEALP